MHGKGQRESELCRRLIVGGQHMPVTTTTTIAAVDSSVVDTDTVDSFCKDGRKVSVGDCALFKPPHDSPPFIGIIRRLTFSGDNNLQLGVNWLYRPAELKLGKGILPEAAPNEIFYSFHRDETPAASLLHPCKVAFLSKGAELPTGISSFICRRVYDISNECLWWLSDQDYIKELQEEVGQLLNKTRVEMHATVQPGGRSPKPMNGSISSSQLKSGADNVQSSVTSFPPHVKGKKRERGGDHGPESIKRERSIKTDDVDSCQIKAESMLKSEISKITEKGGLVNSEGVEKLVHLMQPDRNEKKMDLICRSMLASVVAATENFDCLTRFVQLRGLPVLDEWLQDVHKGRIGESSNTKDGDKSVEEFLFVLLRALDKLPVNLQALQMCHIGRSVNHLRQHKNTEIQRKARSLVDTWKKRVEAEMNIIDAKSGSSQAVTWPSKSRLPEASHSISKNPGGSNDVTKSAVSQLSASRMASIRTSQGETTMKSASLSPSSTKPASSPASGKEGQPRVLVGGSCDVHLAREDKSSSSSQSHNNSQSISGKEDGRSSAVSMNSIKISTGGSRHRKSINGYPGSSVSGSQKESPAGRSSHRNPTSEKLPQSGLSGEKATDVPVLEGSGHKLIVKISNRGRSPAQSASGGSYEDPTNMSSRASSPVLSEKNDQFDRTSKEKTDADHSNVDANTESWQSNDFKDILTGSEDGDGSPAAAPEEERSKVVDSRISAEVRAACTSGTELNSGKLHEASFSSMNALIESCVKYSESNIPMSLGDAIGMNLLASVAAEEMSKSNMVSPSVSPQRNSPTAEEACTSDDVKSKSPPGDISAGDSKNDDGNREKLVSASASWSENKLLSSMGSVMELPGDRKVTISPYQETITGGCSKQFNSPCFDSQMAGEKLEFTEKSSGEVEKYASSPHGVSKKAIDGELSKQFQDGTVVPHEVKVEGALDAKLGGDGTSVLGDKVTNTVASLEDQKPAVEDKNGVSRVLSIASTEMKPSSFVVNSEKVEANDTEERLPTSSIGDPATVGSGRSDEASVNLVNLSEKATPDQGNVEAPVEDKACAETHFITRNQKGEASVGLKDVVPVQNSGLLLHQKESNFSAVEADKTKDPGSAIVETSSVSAAAPESALKMKFDLNEGFISDEGKYGDPINLTGPGCLSNVHIMNPLPFAISSVSCSLPASITVAAAAKGPFVPPEELLRVKGEFGWKGSAATSAFRPAEPRKSLDMPLSSATTSRTEASTSKHCRPQLDIDLNVPDERTFDDINGQDSALELISPLDHIANRASLKNEVIDSPAVRCPGGLDLDLNRLDEPSDAGQCSVSNSCRLDGAVFPSKASTIGLPVGDARRDFDLNNGPVVDDSNGEQSLFHANHQGSMRAQLPAANFRLNNPEIGNLSSWFTPGSTYSTVTLPSILPDRVEQPSFPIVTPGAQRILGPAGSPFTPDVYRSSVLSSSPAVPFQSPPFQYPVFPFGTSFALPSASFSVGSTSFVDSSSGGRIYTPSVNSQLLGPVGTVSSQYPRPYIVGLPDSNSNGTMDHNKKWGRQGLDLNAGPGVLDMEGREESVSLTSRQLSVAGSQALAEEHGRMYAGPGGVLKRKEPDGGWDNESFRFRQSWH